MKSKTAFLTLALALALAAPPVAVAQTSVTPVPQKHIPPPVLMELRAVESQFDLALSRDCAADRCVSKGCTYRDHVVVDTPRSSSLPGIHQGEAGPGSVPAQEYLTEARCEFAVEKDVPPKDVQALARRLEQRLSKGWLRVSVGRQVLEPIPESLTAPVAPKAEVPDTPAPLLEPPPAPQWDAGVAVRELWVSLLPHFFWMLGVLLGTLAVLTIIWGLRRVGRESLEEKALASQLAAGAMAPPAEEADASERTDAPAPEASAEPPPAVTSAEELAFVEEQRRLWGDRIAQAELAKDEGGVVELLREWLRSGEFELLAKAILLFGDRLSLAFPSDGELAARKVEFAEFLRSLDEAQLPSDADFFCKLKHHAISSSLLAQSDADSYRSLREEFGSTGLARLAGALPPRYGALLFALAPQDCHDDVARALSPELRLSVATQLLASNRISREEQGYLFEALDAARSGQPLPPAPKPTPHAIQDRGRAFDAAAAVSALLAQLEADQRQALFQGALQRSSGALPLWYQDILYPEMLLKIPSEHRADLLLEVDPRGLAGWSSVQPPEWQASFVGRLSPSMQNVVKANMAFRSREDQLQLARQGRNELVSAVKRLVARGKVSFPELVA